jgi:hypothetical protein
MPDNAEIEAPRLYAFLNIVYYLWTALLWLAIALDIGTGIDNFLHAPIGIKDNPPDPGALVDLARDLIIPLVIGWVVLKLFRWFAKEMGAKFVAGAVAWIVGVAFLVSAMLAKSRWHPEFIPGSAYLFDIAIKVFGYALLAGVVLLDAYFAVNYVRAITQKEDMRTFRWFAVTAGYVFSTILFVAGFIFKFMSHGDTARALAAYGVLIGIVGLLFAPKDKETGNSRGIKETDPERKPLT